MLRRAGRLRAAAAVARARAASTTASPDRDRPGLYGLVGLHAPEDFARLTREATTTSTSLVASIAKDWSLDRLTRDGGGNGGAARVVTDLDEISDVVCAVVDVAEVCRNTHPDERWVRAAERAYIDLQQHVGNLNADRSLYDALRAADDGGASSSSSSSSSLPPEAARVASTLRHDFERGGVHLEGDARARLEDANSRVIRFGMAFQARSARALVPIRPRSRGARRSLRTFSPGASLRPRHGFKSRPYDAFRLRHRRLSTPPRRRFARTLDPPAEPR
tara:strand:+ start:2797 stop:3627 length:831 start_codon:yes stop_codon:yes gene_type:complete